MKTLPFSVGFGAVDAFLSWRIGFGTDRQDGFFWMRHGKLAQWFCRVERRLVLF